MRVYEAFETSDKLIEEGRQCSIEFGGKVIANVWVRPSDAALNANYRRELAELSVGFKAGEEIDDDTDRELLWKVYARTVIVKWEWIDPQDQKDKALTFNEKNALILFKRAPKFFEGIQRGSRNWSQFRAAHEEDATGN